MESKAMKHSPVPALTKAPASLAVVACERRTMKERILNLIRFVVMSVGHFRMARDLDWETWRRMEFRNEFPDYDRKHPIEYRQWL